jgi:phosphatidylglycerol---prolipoprotein diacylglyceryl transferase
MLPTLFEFQVGGTTIAVGAYSTFMVLAWISTVVLGTLFASRRGIPARKALVVYAVSLLAALLGGRLLDVLTMGPLLADGTSRLWSLAFQGFALYGALLCGSLTALLVAWAMRLPLWRLADSGVPALAVGIALMRVGCFLRGCCFGLPTALPWGVTFPDGSPAWEQQMVSGATGILGGMMGQVLPVHPTQLYELVAALLIGALAVVLMRRDDVPDGVTFLVCSALFTLFRLGDYYLRSPYQTLVMAPWFYPVLYAGILLLLTGLTIMRYGAAARARSRETTPPAP